MAMTMTDVRVINITEETVESSPGVMREMSRIYYQIGEFGPYSVAIPKLELSAQRVLTEIRQDAQKYLDVINIQF